MDVFVAIFIYLLIPALGWLFAKYVLIHPVRNKAFNAWLDKHDKKVTAVLLIILLIVTYLLVMDIRGRI